MKTSKTVLIAEDDNNDVFLLRTAFATAELFCNFTHVRNGTEAVNYLAGLAPYSDRTKYPLPDLMVTDLNMPEMDGLQLLGWLEANQELGLLPVVVLSSSVSESDRTTALALGAKAYHVKPAQFCALVDLVRELSNQFLRGRGDSDELFVSRVPAHGGAQSKALMNSSDTSASV